MASWAVTCTLICDVYLFTKSDLVKFETGLSGWVALSEQKGGISATGNFTDASYFSQTLVLVTANPSKTLSLDASYNLQHFIPPNADPGSGMIVGVVIASIILACIICFVFFIILGIARAMIQRTSPEALDIEAMPEVPSLKPAEVILSPRLTRLNVENTSSMYSETSQVTPRDISPTQPVFEREMIEK